MRDIKELIPYIKRAEQYSGDYIFCDFSDMSNHIIFKDTQSFKKYLFNSVPMNKPYIFVDKIEGEIVIRLEEEIFNLFKTSDGYKIVFYQDREKSDQFKDVYSREDVKEDLLKIIKAS